MSNGVITGIRGNLSGALAAGVITAIRGASGGGAGRVTTIRGRAAADDTGRVTTIRGRTQGTVTYPVTAGSAATFEPFTVATLTASPDTAAVAAWSWVQETGPTVTLVGTGAARQYITPPSRAGASCRFRVTAQFTDGTSSSATVTHTVNAHGGPWMYVGGVLVGVGINPPTV